MTIEAMKQALEAFRKIHEGCGEVKKDNLSKESNELATLVRKDCNYAMLDLNEAIAEAEKQEAVAFRNIETGEFCTGGFLRKDLAKWQPLYTSPVHASDIPQEPVDETAKDRHEFECPRCGHCCQQKEWVGLDPEMMRNTPIEFNRGALWAERYLKEKNT